MRRFIWTLAVLAFAVGGAQADPIMNSPTGLASPTTTITFSKVVLANGTPLTNQYSAFGVTFSGLFYNPQPTLVAPNISPPDAGNFSAPGVPPVNLTNPFSFFFTLPRSAAAFAMVTNLGTATFEARLGGGMVEMFSAPTDVGPPNNFYGFQNSAFDEIRMTVTTNNNAALIDNIQIGAAIPEPSSLALLGVGALGLLGYGWKAPEGVNSRRKTIVRLRAVSSGAALFRWCRWLSAGTHHRIQVRNPEPQINGVRAFFESLASLRGPAPVVRTPNTVLATASAAWESIGRATVSFEGVAITPGTDELRFGA